MSKLIPLKRGEAIVTQDGFPTLRFLEWLTAATAEANITQNQTITDIPTVNISVGALDSLLNRIENLESQMVVPSIKPPEFEEFPDTGLTVALFHQSAQ